MTAIEAHDAMVAAYNAQRARSFGEQAGDDVWTGALARRFRADPRRPLTGVLAAIAEQVRPDDVVVDAGGGAGRFGLPLALRCREVVNVDPSGGMRGEFEAIASEAGIKNARFVQKDWMDADGIEGNIILVAHVTYFVPRIEQFVRKLVAAAQRRVIMNVSATPPPNMSAGLHRMVYDEELALVPGYGELLPVLWEMGILPDVRVQPPAAGEVGALQVLPNREAAVDSLLLTIAPRDRERARAAFESRFEEIFISTAEGFQRRSLPDGRQILITWETGTSG